MKDVVKFYPKPYTEAPMLHNKDVPVNQEHINAQHFIIVRTGIGLLLIIVRRITQWLFGYH